MAASRGGLEVRTDTAIHLALLSEASGNEGVQVRCLPGSAHHADVHFCGRAREHAASHRKRASSVFMISTSR
jgi:hypothetical protein